MLIGDDPASKIYVKNKQKFFSNNGCYSETFTFDSSISQDELISFVQNLNQDDKVFLELQDVKQIIKHLLQRCHYYFVLK